MKADKAEQLLIKGHEALEAGDFRAAAEAFAEALKEEDSTPPRNNLAYAVFMGGEPRRALEVIEPLLNPEGGSSQANPFTYALAARIYCSLGQEKEARRWLRKAERSFDEGLSALRHRRAGALEMRTFQEYTAIIMQAAGDLRDHRLVFDLYRRWESYHVLTENRYLAGVASFNMGRYKRAASLWGSIAHAHPLFSDMELVAFLMERDIFPPFELSYKHHSEEKLMKMVQDAAADEEARRRCVENGFFRIRTLAQIAEERDSEGSQVALYNLVYYGGEWGEKLGRKVLENSWFPLPLKMGAAHALVDRGILREDEPVPVLIDGEQRLIHFKTISVMLEPDEELDKVVQHAVELRDQGKIAEATSLLQDLLQQEKYYPPAMMTLANLLRQQDKLEEALDLMELLEETAPEDPAVLFNFAALMLQMDDPEQARAYLNRIDPDEITEEIRSKIELLEEEIEKAELRDDLLSLPERIMKFFTEDQRQEIEKKTLPADATLARGLKNMPANWLTAACKAHGLKPLRHRREREDQLVEFLTDRKNLARAVENLDAAERELLEYLLQRGGWSRLNAVTRKFGSMEGDGFYWEEKKPQSILGTLWSRALVMVGRTSVSGQRCKIATIPIELREPLGEILGNSNG
ncbi:TPR domain-containing protein [Thermacetogenium phaeum DSM 12270]|uniref:TPR domain-containing protein n=1 Tax=Thermacetogenium phaeum (strain ATCC BAA-254 / DSM 26808 / PB) TaxID=1089553 RepID=K4LEI4_THEPS|nr:tetratricopeptide repeat protein [Thermacetogenium phaeum]AFV10497.1 TPR domain-containing protein [Thermacetogenium phaeum DSM 12270]